MVVSTGILGRGLDLVNVKLVVNFDMPANMDEYVHQVWRISEINVHTEASDFFNDDTLCLNLSDRSSRSTGPQRHRHHLHE